MSEALATSSTAVPVTRCKARSKRTGNPCRNPPVNGAVVCRMHGGSAPQVRKAAAERLKELQAPAITATERALEADRVIPSDAGPITTPDHPTRLRAATAVFDRTGLGPSSTTNVTLTTEETLAVIIARLSDEG